MQTKEKKKKKKKKLSTTMRLTVLRLDAEIRAVNSKVALVQLSKTHYLNRIDPKGVAVGMDAELQRLAAQKDVWVAEYRALMESVSQQTGVDLSKNSFDDATGELTPLSKKE